ncbi:MAG: hypothetical protein IPK02_14195 [Candidatus Accumulibacter sp.]|uniref:Uncharacterized protein n=1 Tax=Candidatus Accumulibacter affinis TaxID=2954384 RepID=A0A935W5B1_9PROT|nr:hypothetical protein [Candidatus Accumulibacter affinis]
MILETNPEYKNGGGAGQYRHQPTHGKPDPQQQIVGAQTVDRLEEHLALIAKGSQPEVQKQFDPGKYRPKAMPLTIADPVLHHGQANVAAIVRRRSPSIGDRQVLLRQRIAVPRQTPTH